MTRATGATEANEANEATEADDDLSPFDIRRWGGLLAWQWAVLLALAVYAPLGLTGYVLTYDMVWVPHLDLQRLELWGLDTALPRAVPSDAVVAALGAVVPAALVQRLVLVGAMVLAAAGATRLTPGWSLPATLTTATFYAWNPFVAERLVLGQWPLLIGYAALPWLIAALRADDGPRWGTATVALAATAMSPAGGLIGLVVGLSSAWGRGAFRLMLTAVLVNAPWVVAGVLHASAAGTDPDSFRAFDAQPEGLLGRWGAVLSLGGIWNRDVVPDSRLLWPTLLLVLVMGVVMVVGLVALSRENRGFLIALAVPAGVALAVVVAGRVVPDQLGRLAADVPGVGLLRDGTRYLAMLAPLEAVALGAGAAELARRVPRPDVRQGVAVLLVLLPIVTLPDLAWGVGGRLDPTTYPPTWERARLTIASGGVEGDILVLPFSAYRQPDWNDDRPVLDPAGRYFDRATVTEDALVVAGPVDRTIIGGEDPRAARLGRILRADTRGGAVDPKRLARAGIGIVVVDTDAPGAKKALREVRRLDEFGRTGPDRRGAELRLYAVDGARTPQVDRLDRWVMIAAWSVAGLALLVGSMSAGRGAVRRRRTVTRRQV
ncbi:hypothetical protein [Aeromicrobium sp.]|uniref:hypothetical protein n=1 Tax=Aeromicrobium sp. TaxID=1871063 RepID=UPI003D6C1D82